MTLFPTFKHILTVLALSLAAGPFSAGTAQPTSPSTSVAPYLQSHLPGVEIESILTVDDGVVPKTGGGTTGLVGIPDGIGAIDGAELSPAEPDYFYLLVNHELNATQGVMRDHNEIGAFVSKWKVDKTTHEVVEGDDLIKQFYEWDELSSAFVAGTASFDRMCSSDRPAPGALYNSATSLGTQQVLYFNGEETFGGRAFAHVVTGPNAGNSYHLEHFGYAAFENVVLSPTEQDTTIAAMLDDASDGEVYFYIGEKQATGNEVERAGLVGGNLYALAVEGKPFELAANTSEAVDDTETFTLKLIGEPGNRPVDGTDVEARGTDTITPLDPSQTFESLKMGGPEDGVWDTRPGRENFFYFATKGTSSGSVNAPTRVWQLEFNDIADPAAGGTMTMLLSGPQNRLGSLDNMAFEVIDGRGKLYIQEDLGSEARLSRIWEYDLDTGSLEEIAQHDPARFFDGGPDLLTTNEESSGIIGLTDILGEGWFAASVQVHTSSGLSNPDEQVEHGQLVLMNIGGRGTDAQRERVVDSGDTWDYRVDGIDPGAAWNETGFAIDGNWNVNTAGVATGPQPTMLGYGEAPGALDSDLGQPSSPRPAAYYFRREFNLADPADTILFDLYMKVDDGAVVYINGVEVARFNMAYDTAVDNDTYAAANESAELDWKHIPITGVDLPLQTTGNVVAVSLHQENDGSSDIRMDMELIARQASPDTGTAPAAPAGLSVDGESETQLDLSWNAQSDAQFFRIERRVAGDVAWRVVEAGYPGSFSSYTDTDVESGTTYDYRIWAANIHGRSALSDTVNGSTTASLVPVIFEEDFEIADSFGAFTAVDVAASDRNWSWVSWDFGSTGAAQGNNFGGSAPTEDWLITTHPINFLFYRNESLEYGSQISFSGPAPQVLYSTNYDPSAHADPNQADWTLIHEDTSTFGTLTKVGPFDLTGVSDTASIAFKYTGAGGAGGQSTRFTIDDVIIKGECGFDFQGGEDSDIESDAASPWTVVNLGSAFGWQYDTRAGQQAAFNNNFGSGAGGVNGGTASDDYLISPPLNVAGPLTGVDFDYYENFGDTLPQPLSVLVTAGYSGDPSTTNWVDITPSGLNGSTSDAWTAASSEAFSLTGSDVRVAFRYRSAGNGGGTTKRIGVDDVCVESRGGALEGGFTFNRNGGNVSFNPSVTGGTPPYDLSWNFGDGGTSDEQAPAHEYTETGVYTVRLTITDDAGNSITVEQTEAIEVTQFVVPEPADLRVATYNASMNRSSAGALADALAAGDDSQIQRVAEVIQRADPDIVLINEFDQVYDSAGHFDRAATVQSVENFIANYLEVSQAPGVDPVSYPYYFVEPTNTGVPSGYDFNNDGSTSGPDDAYGFGEFAGKYGLVLLSKHRIVQGAARTFQKFRWKDMPDAYLPPDPNDTDGDGDTGSYYNDDELDIFRLSSKSHWDVPVIVRGMGMVHILASHPTPPVFDDGTATGYPSDGVADWNGLRNHDEIRFWADYIDPSKSGYIYDDREWERAGDRPPRRPRGGLNPNSRFVVVGDENADPVDGDATFNPIEALLGSSLVDTSVTPTSDGALEQVPSGSNRGTKTAGFNLRADYVLPSERGWDIAGAWVFWPLTTDMEADLLSASDHRMVVVDLAR